jgi:hypothetical protein
MVVVKGTVAYASRLVVAAVAIGLCSGCGLQVGVSVSPLTAAPSENVTYTVTVTNLAGCTVGSPLGFAVFVAPQSQIPVDTCGLSSGGVPSSLFLPSNAERMETDLESLMASAPASGIMCEQPTQPGQPILCTLNATLAPNQSLQTTITGPLFFSGPLTALVVAVGDAPGPGCNDTVTGGLAAGTGCANLVGEASAPLLSRHGVMALLVILAAVGCTGLLRRYPA